MTNVLERAIDCNDADDAAEMIRNALGIESDDVANYVFPKTWPTDREQRARIIGEWLRAERRIDQSSKYDFTGGYRPSGNRHLARGIL
jgi:uncharacterized protein HemY